MTPQDQEAVERLTDPTNPVLAVELEPCPFCGGDAEMDTRQGYTNCFNGRPETGIAIYCRDCGVQHMICRGDVPDVEPEHVIELWNRRAHLSQGWKPDREAVARIIDAEAFDIDLEVFATARWGSATEGRVAVAQIMLAERQKAALVKADAILALPTPAPKDEGWRTPEGWVLVPREPTEAMLKAAFGAMNETPSGTWKRMKAEGQTPRRLFDVKMAPRYRAMIAAAPTKSAGGTET